MKTDRINILGAGLVGSLLSLFLSKRGFHVTVFEKREDPRKTAHTEGRSINLALSHRGIKALEMAGAFDSIREDLIPMKGRMMHDPSGNLSFQPYGKEGQYINSVSRSGLNRQLIQLSEAAGTSFHFAHKCEAIDVEKTAATFLHKEKMVEYEGDLLIGADGAYSSMRKAFMNLDRFNFQQHYIEHGYKELTINPLDGDFAMEPNYLHIWPRGNYMLIALPNPDRSFTCTLFFPFEGEGSFASIRAQADIVRLFETDFPDVIPIMPDFAEQFEMNPVSSLITVRTSPWNVGNCLLIGDAGHAIVPFYGQGMNAGFEDCRLFMEWGESMDFEWSRLLPQFSNRRKPDADAIAELALRNFIEMRDKVADERFLNIKKVERRLQDAYPEIWTPLYSMVTFSDIPYHEALNYGKLQEKVMNELPENFDPVKVDLEMIIARFNAAKQAAR